ncbi:hypothetical protein [Actinophytocola sp.]|uniref:hypothetical protein n=1 Tax=Actinophytocola sp. TaxID=1872138 RepID=UPI002EDAED00
MIVEIAVERYRFSCANCGHTWTADYDVQFLEDNEGDVWAYYRLDGVPVLNPAFDDILCPVCGRNRVFRELVARRDVPVAAEDKDEPRQKVTADADTRRATVPHLPATQ